MEITETLYSSYSKRSSQAILRLHNTSFVHGKLCTELFHTPKTMTRRKMFGRYFHSLTSYAPILYRIICLRSLNAEMQERMFGQCKAITKATSSQRPNHIITNILLRLQEESKSNIKTLKLQEGEITRLAITLGSKSNTIIPKQWLHHITHQYQAHLERISDFVASGPGSWWRELDGGIEFFDVVIPGSSPPQHRMFHYRSTELTDIDSYLFAKWEACIEGNIRLPATHIRTYTAAGSLYSIDRADHPPEDEVAPTPSLHVPRVPPRLRPPSLHVPRVPPRLRPPSLHVPRVPPGLRPPSQHVPRVPPRP